MPISNSTRMWLGPARVESPRKNLYLNLAGIEVLGIGRPLRIPERPTERAIIGWNAIGDNH